MSIRTFTTGGISREEAARTARKASSSSIGGPKSAIRLWMAIGGGPDIGGGTGAEFASQWNRAVSGESTLTPFFFSTFAKRQTFS